MRDKVQEARSNVLGEMSGEYETPEQRAIVDALIAAVREDEREKCETEMRRLRDEVARASWAGQIDRASGAFDPRERHEMGG